MPRKKEASRRSKPPKNLEEYYWLGIKTKIFPDQRIPSNGRFVFEDGSVLHFDKANDYRPIAEGDEDSFAVNLFADIKGFSYMVGNTNEVGFEITLLDGSILRQVPMGAALAVLPSAEEIIKDIQSEETRKAIQERLKSIDPKFEKILDAKVINKKT